MLAHSVPIVHRYPNPMVLNLPAYTVNHSVAKSGHPLNDSSKLTAPSRPCAAFGKDFCWFVN